MWGSGNSEEPPTIVFASHDYFYAEGLLGPGLTSVAHGWPGYEKRVSNLHLAPWVLRFAAALQGNCDPALDFHEARKTGNGRAVKLFLELDETVVTWRVKLDSGDKSPS
jgi:hypothetical protein